MNPTTPMGAIGTARDGPAVAGRFVFLDQALWGQFLSAEDPEVLARTWLALQCRLIGEVDCGVVVLGEPDVGPFAPAAFWPDEAAFELGLSETAERAMAERKGVAVAGDGMRVAYPLLVAGRLFGVAAVQVSDARREAREVLRQLQWGAGWMEVLLRRRQADQHEQDQERAAIAFDLLATVLEHDDLEAACNGVVTELATRLRCDPVSLGFVRRHRVVVCAISHAAQFGRRMNLVRDIGAAMDEAVDQAAVVLYPPRPEWEYRITRAHEALAGSHQAGAILTIPLHAHGEPFGALTFERPPGESFDEATVEVCDGVASLLGPILREKRANDRSIFWKNADTLGTQVKRLLGPHYFGRKLVALAAALLVVLFTTWTDTYRVAAPAVLEGSVQRAIVAPFDGYLASQHVRPGEVVQAGSVMAVLDDRDLTLERLRWATTERQRAAEYDRAIADRDRSEANIAQARREQAAAQIALLDAQIERSRVTAPFEGLVVSGDLAQNVGGALQRGQELYRIAPLDAYRVILKVGEGDVADIHEGQRGTLRLASLPEVPIAYTVRRVTPIAEQAEGRNYFRVEAALDEVSERLRPGMEGVGKTAVEQRLVIRIWTRRLVDWARLALWKWLP